MSAVDAIIIFVAGLFAGGINTVVGSGSLITFPTLLALGYPPIVANVSNNVGLVPGALSGAYGYRRELRGQRARLVRLGPASLCGGVTGAVLLLVLPSSVFDRVVPVLVALAVVLVFVGPRLAARRERAVESPRARLASGAMLFVTVYLAGIYGGYFGAAQGVMLLAILSTFLSDELQRLNAVKVVLTTLINGAAAIVFVIASDVDWAVAGVLAGGAAIGGQLGARIGRRLDPAALRWLIMAIGVAAIVKLLL